MEEKKVEVHYQDGKVVLEAEYSQELGSVKMSASVSLMAILEKVAAQSETKLDDQVVEVLKKLLPVVA